MGELALELPPGAKRLLESLAAAGARPFVVGGSVRDACLRRGAGDHDIDIDVEVFGMGTAALEEHLATLGTVDAVGQAFTVFKVSGLEGVAGNVDVSIPRRDSKVGPGHRGIAVTGDPDLSIEEASRRRDFTINAMLWDPLDGVLHDPHGGQADLEARRLRCVDPESFAEDPLRALRAIQLAARFGLTVDEETASLCAGMPLAELPPERIFGEIEKLLLQAKRPSIGLALLHDWDLLPVVAPELVPLKQTEQEPDWHPEGDVWTHTLLAMDEAALLIDDLDRPRKLAVMLGTLCHDLGKPATTLFEDGRIRSRGHEEAGVPPTLTLLDRLKVFTLLGYDLRGQIVGLVRHHLKPGQLYAEREHVGDGAIRRLARKCEPRLLYRVARADCLGRTPGDFPPVAMEWFLERALALEVTERPPEPLLRGRDVLALGVDPGPLVGRVLQEIYERQLDGEFTDVEDARAAAARVVGSERDSAG